MQSIKIKRIDIVNAHAILGMFDGRVEKVTNDKGEVRETHVPYQLGMGVRLIIAQNRAVLRPIVEAYEQARNGLISQYADGAQEIKATVTVDGVEQQNPNFAKYQQEVRTILDEVIPVNIHPINVSALEIEKNKFDPTMLEHLLPLIDIEQTWQQP